MEDTAALNEVARLWGATSPLAGSSEEELVQDQPKTSPRRKGKRKAEQAREPGSRGRPRPDFPIISYSNWRVVARHETALQVLEANRSWIIFVDPGEVGIIPQLASNCQLEEESRPWRVQLWPQTSLDGRTAIMEAVARMQKLSAGQTAQQLLFKVKLLSTKPFGWNYMRWNQDKQSYEATDAAPLPHDRAIKAAQMLTEHMVKDGVIHAFHATGGMSTDKDKVTMFKLTLSLEGRSATSVVGLSSAQIDRTTGKKPSTPSQRPLADAAGRGSMIAKNGKGEPRLA